MAKRNAIFIIILLATAAILLGIFQEDIGERIGQKVDPKSDLTKPYKEARVVKEQPQTIAAGFPADFPIEAGAQHTSSYKYVPPTVTTQQATLEYISQKSLAENQKIFSGYLAASGYKIINKVEQPKLAFYYGQKTDSDLTVNIADQEGTIYIIVSYIKK